MLKYFNPGVALLALGLIGCGTPGVKFEKAAQPAQSQQDVAAVADAARNGAIAFNLPVSKILVKASGSPANPTVENAQGEVATNPNNAAHAKQSSKKSKPNQVVASSAQTGTAGKNNPQQSNTKPEASAAQTGVTITVKTLHNLDYSVSVLPAESDRSYRAIGVNDFFSQNELGVTKIANTDIPTSVQNKFTDMTKARINSLGQLITTTMSLAALVSSEVNETPKCDDPKIPDFVADASTAKLGEEIGIGLGGCWSYVLIPDKNMSDANPDPRKFKHALESIKRDDFERNYVTGKNVGVWPVPSCMDVTLNVSGKGSAQPELSVAIRIIDPEYVRLLGVPSQGSISMHSVCGADFSNTPLDRWGTGFDDISALEAQAQAIAKQVKK